MQKLIPIIVVVVVSLALWFAITSRGKKNDISSSSTQTASNKTQDSASTKDSTNPTETGTALLPMLLPLSPILTQTNKIVQEKILTIAQQLKDTRQLKML